MTICDFELLSGSVHKMYCLHSRERFLKVPTFCTRLLFRISEFVGCNTSFTEEQQLQISVRSRTKAER